jgi:hypothetical protein
MNKLPITTSLNDVEIKKIYGQSVFDYYQQVKKLFASHATSANVKSFFAEPSINKSRQEISWYTDVEGEIIPIGKLSDRERILASSKLSAYYNDIIKVADEFTAIQGARSLGAEALRAMLVTPRISESLFIIGDVLVLTEWGCIPFGSLPEVYDLIIQDKNYHKTISPSPIIPPTEVGTYPSEDETHLSPPIKQEDLADQEEILDVSEEPVAPQVAETPSQPEAVVIKRPWWSFWSELLKWLLLLILLLLLFYGLFTRIWYVRMSSNDAIVIENKLSLQKDISNLWSRADEILKECKNELIDNADGGVPQEPINHRSEVLKNEGNQKIIDQDHPVTSAHPNAETLNETGSPPPEAPTKQNNDPSNIINKQAQEEMHFPKNQKDLSFLQGCWKSSTPAYDSGTNVPLELKYCFEGDKGVGQFLINMSDGDKCSAPMQAKRQGKLLYMSYSNINCASRKYPPAKIICHQENTIALCNHIDIINGHDEPIERQILAAKFLKLEEN